MKKIAMIFSIALVATAFLNVATASPGNDEALTSKIEKEKVTSNFGISSEPVMFHNYEMAADGVFVIDNTDVCFGNKTVISTVASAKNTTINDVFETGIGIRPEKNSYNGSMVATHTKIYCEKNIRSWCGKIYSFNKNYALYITTGLV